MSADGIKRIDFLRTLYRSQNTQTSSDVVRELQEVKNELKIANDEQASITDEISNAKNSPYLPDQKYYFKNVVYNSNEETSWKEVKSYEQTLSDARRKLNII